MMTGTFNWRRLMRLSPRGREAVGVSLARNSAPVVWARFRYVSEPAQLITLLALFPAWAVAGADYQWADVLDVEPVYETVRRIEPVQACRDERVRHRLGGHSATPPILGAIIGAALGNAVGHKKANKRIGAVAGAILGGSIGADIGRSSRPGGYRTETVCEWHEEVREEERLTGYHVRYQYNGTVYATRMRNHPGDQIRVRVRVTPVS